MAVSKLRDRPLSEEISGNRTKGITSEQSQISSMHNPKPEYAHAEGKLLEKRENKQIE